MASTEHKRGGRLPGPIGPQSLQLERLERVAALRHHRTWASLPGRRRLRRRARVEAAQAARKSGIALSISAL